MWDEGIGNRLLKKGLQPLEVNGCNPKCRSIAVFALKASMPISASTPGCYYVDLCFSADSLFLHFRRCQVNRLLLMLVFTLGMGSFDSANAETILFESGTLGPTGLAQFDVAATNVNASVFTGVRFELTQQVQTSQVGGHFLSAAGGNFFGAIVQLDDGDDFPDSSDLSTADVLGIAELIFPVASNEVFGDLELSLNTGWYALVFGSGLFDTTGSGAATRNNPDLGNPEYVSRTAGGIWRSLEGASIPFEDHRFVLTGQIIPEPASITFAILCISSAATFMRGRVVAPVI